MENTLKSVFVALHENTTSSNNGIMTAKYDAIPFPFIKRTEVAMESAPVEPPDIKAVLAFNPMNSTEIIPAEIRNIP